MPTVEKTTPGTVVVHGVGTFNPGTKKNVDSETAEYLTQERGGFEYASGDFPREGDAEDVDYEETSREPTDDAEPGDTICTCDPGQACDDCGGQCPTVKSDGDVCGRDRPCSYHDNNESDA